MTDPSETRIDVERECPTSSAQMVPITCDACGKQIGYGWDAEYSQPQSIFRCADCYANIGGAV